MDTTLSYQEDSQSIRRSLVRKYSQQEFSSSLLLPLRFPLLGYQINLCCNLFPFALTLREWSDSQFLIRVTALLSPHYLLSS